MKVFPESARPIRSTPYGQLAGRLCLLVVAISAVFCGTSKSRASDPEPNILFILIDDMGWPDLGCYGHAFHQTPHLDQLASQGVRFTDFYATPVCSSTRATIETGQNAARTGITDFLPGHWKPFAQLVVPPMPDHLDHALTTPGELQHRADLVRPHAWQAANADLGHLTISPVEVGASSSHRISRKGRHH